jgi:membrane protein YqaA with SNARE-associated domain
MLRNFYNTVIDLSERPAAPVWLFAIAFAEASFFPIPPDALLIPMALAQPRKAFWFAFICTCGSVLGGALGYAIGFFLLDKLAQPIIHVYHYEAAFAGFQAKFAQYGVWVILIKGLTPIPYKIVTIAAGAAAFSFPRRAILSSGHAAADFRRVRPGVYRKTAGSGDVPGGRRDCWRLFDLEVCLKPATATSESECSARFLRVFQPAHARP